MPGGERGRGATDDADRLVHEDPREEGRRKNDEETDGEGQQDRREAPPARHLPLRRSATGPEADGQDDRPREGRAERRQGLHGERADPDRDDGKTAIG